MKKIFITALACLLMVSGCSWFKGKPDEEKPLQQLVQEGVDAYDSGDFRKALESFEQLKDWYPFSKYAILAELKIADANYHLEQYEDAVFAYESFEELHPRNEAIPYVIYQIGRCYFEQIDTIDRDQTPARKALDTFNRLIKQYPRDPYAQKARPAVIKCEQSLAGHEYYVGVFYYKAKHYRAARQRFLAVIRDYPDVGYHQLALNYIANCEAHIGMAAADTENPE